MSTPPPPAHTPGPWHWERRYYPSSKRVDVFLNGNVEAPKDKQVLALRDDWAEWLPWCDSANARLIAAAPALLEALRATLDRLEAWYDYARIGAQQAATPAEASPFLNQQNNYGALIQSLRAALAQAEGK